MRTKLLFIATFYVFCNSAILHAQDIDPCLSPATYTLECAREDVRSNGISWSIAVASYEETAEKFENRVLKRARIRSRIKTADSHREHASLKKTYKQLKSRINTLRNDKYKLENVILAYQRNIAAILTSHPSAYSELPLGYEELEF